MKGRRQVVVQVMLFALIPGINGCWQLLVSLKVLLSDPGLVIYIEAKEKWKDRNTNEAKQRVCQVLMSWQGPSLGSWPVVCKVYLDVRKWFWWAMESSSVIRFYRICHTFHVHPWNEAWIPARKSQLKGVAVPFPIASVFRCMLLKKKGWNDYFQVWNLLFRVIMYFQLLAYQLSPSQTKLQSPA